MNKRVGICLLCGELFVTDKWHIKTRKYCKQCRYKLTKIAIKDWRLNNKDKVSEIKKRHYYKTNGADYKRWRQNNHDLYLLNRKKYYMKKKNDPLFKLNNSIRVSINKALLGHKCGHNWEKLVGYTINDLKIHLESQFDINMSWANYGSYWHIDHIMPINSFNASDIKELKLCWSLDNLRPLEAHKNMSKGSKIPIFI